MHFFKYLLVTFMITLSTLFFVGCEGGEADYSFDEVLEAQYLLNVEDLIQGTIDFITKKNMYVDQNSSIVTTVKADSSDNLLYSIVGGLDSSLFTIDEQTGEVSFISTPAYDAQSSNIYDVIIGVKTKIGELSTLHLTVTVVEDIDEVAPIIDFAVSSIDAVSNSAVITQIQARPAKESDYLRYAVVGPDATRFTIDNEGNLAFKAPFPDYGSTPNQLFTIQIEVKNGNNKVTTTEIITITLVGNRDEIRPVIESSSFSVIENALGNMQVKVATLGTGVVTKYLLSGDDASEFVVDTFGVIKFKIAKDFELQNNLYHLSSQVQDDKGNISDIKPLVVTIVDLDEGYQFQSIADVTVLSATQDVTTVVATSKVLTDVTRKYSLNNYQDVFTIDKEGNVAFKAPAIEGENYDVKILVESYIKGTDDLINGSQTISSAFKVTVVENPSLIAPTINTGYETTATVTAPIDSAEAITTISASDEGSLSYTTSGEDALSFNVDDNGNLYFDANVDFTEDGDNVYHVIVDVTDENGNITSTDIITVDLLQDPMTVRPVIVKTTYASPENEVGSISLEASAEGNGVIVAFEIVGGMDMTSFIYLNGYLQFKVAPDFEAARGSSYSLDVVAINNGGYRSDAASIIINVDDVDEKLIFTSLNHFNHTSSNSFSQFITVSPTAGLTLEYAVVSGGDRFSINASTGELTFKTAPVYELNGPNRYTVEINANSQYNGSLTKSPLITVDVVPASRAITFSVSSVDQTIFDVQGEAHLDQSKDTTIQITADSAVNGAQIHYTIEGDSNIFAIDENSGALVISAPAYIYSDQTEINTYRATVVATADDGFNTVDRLPGVMHVNAIDGTPLFSTSSSFVVNENIKSIATVHADLPAVVGSTLKYSVVGGADSVLFKIDETSGALSFWNAQNFENPADANGDNIYEVRVAAKDVDPLNILNVASQNILVSVSNVADAPSNIKFTNGTTSETASDGYRTWFILKWKYYTTTSYRQIVATPSPSNGVLTYSISNNPDSDIFSISSTGNLRIDAERESDDILYTLEIQVSEANGEVSTALLNITILDD